MIHSFFASERGQGLVEYALIIALIAIVVIASLSFVATKLNSTLNNVGSSMP